MVPLSKPATTTTTTATIAQKNCMRRLEELMKEYNSLEQTEERLLGMFDQIRNEEGCLLRGLNEDLLEVTDNHEIIGRKESSPTTGVGGSSSIPPMQQQQTMEEEESRNTEQQIGKQPQQEASTRSREEQQIIRDAQTEPVETPAAVNRAEPAIRPTKRYRKGRARAVMDNETETKKRGQQMEEQRSLARQRLENALFAEDDDDDDDDDDDSSSTSSIII